MDRQVDALVAPERLLDCVHCGLCLNACPTYVELGTEMDSPRGRIYLMKALQEGELGLSADVVRHFDLCLGCRACETACPSGVRYGELIETTRTWIEERHRRPLADRMRRQFIRSVFPYPQRLRPLLLPLRVLERIGVLSWLRSVSQRMAALPKLGSWGALPELSQATPASRRVGLLSGCVAQVLFAETNRATVRVLNRNGCSVVAPGAQGCCGALHLHAGDRGAAMDCARRNIDAFPDDLDAIIVNAAGCGAALKEYGALLADDPAYRGRARAFAARVRDVSEYLVALPLVRPTAAVRERVTYHDACHLAHAQGVRDAPRQLLRQIPGLELCELPDADDCCGSAGSYSLTEPEMARRLGAQKAANIGSTGAPLVAAANPGCAMHIAAALRQARVQATVVHPVELLDRAYAQTPATART